MIDTSIDSNIDLRKVKIGNEDYFKITNSDKMRPFFMSIVSDSNHWMFISSNGGLTAGRKNSEFSLFPYYTDDKITESADITGSKSIFQVHKNGDTFIWEPFSVRDEDKYQVQRNLYKSIYGNSIIFEEVNLNLDLTYRYQWCSSNAYGFVRKSKLINSGNTSVNVSILDGIQNVLPYGVGSDLQSASSNLVDAYKRTELIKETGVGIFALSAIIVDKAEPSEALKANVAWSLGLDNPKYLLSSLQLDAFRNESQIETERDIKAEKGAYFINAGLSLNKGDNKEWYIVANVNQNHSSIVALSNSIKSDGVLKEKINYDIRLGTENLIALNAASDGLQLTNDEYKDTRHFANTLFNIMRGGIFDDGYTIEKWDFKNYIENANADVANRNLTSINELPNSFLLEDLKAIASSSADSDFERLCLEYMPLKFSRRHGDPSRPWNKFSINTRSEIDGSKILDYEGNWRDIFQNWEALAHSYPAYIESMIHKFLNATTFDGYNPYRVTKGGFDWETIEPDDPWSYIGYWGDHQIIYLLKFLEFIEKYQPGKLQSLFNKNVFVYANVPYKIKDYEDLLKNPKDTIEFDEELDSEIRKKRDKIGADGALLTALNEETVKVNFIEKILATVLAKLSNFIPEGGIWMNTQRPEWNDANNALVGNGVSMVTLYYLRRFLKFFDEIFTNADNDTIEISKELGEFFSTVITTFETHKGLLNNSIDDVTRKQVLDALGKAGSDYRSQVYKNSFSGEKIAIDSNELKSFTSTAIQHLEHSINANKRNDNLYHAYNLMTVNEDDSVSISYLDEMLEGQVAVLSSGYLSSKESLKVLDALKNSKLFREDQYSYILYPYKSLKGFMDRNNVPKESVHSSELLKKLIDDGNSQIIEKDLNGDYHFNGNFKNAADLNKALNQLEDSKYSSLISKDKKRILHIFENVFNHKAFTGRSGTFYGYEGLGSIYWHMVSKLLLAVQECCLKAVKDNESDELIGKLLDHYYEINAGIGLHKSPELYGAFPTDPYSHTPAGKGAQQPGMTGQVKEDILSRFGELGVFVEKGQLYFNPCLLQKSEFLELPKEFNYVDVNSQKKSNRLSKDELGFTYCQIPVVYKIGDSPNIEVKFNDGQLGAIDGLSLTMELSHEVFNRTGKITQIQVNIPETYLK
ncbi:hypothetical protein [Winogradskyella sp. A3E31]|uniref:hypothetical protein n=1 Tax=Winogradskyella sp. A3E31 TaxID=3349637 RepID=UPI00398AB287